LGRAVAGAPCGRGGAAAWAPEDARAPPSAAIAELFRKSRRLLGWDMTNLAA
jgi:hypothetical protein